MRIEINDKNPDNVELVIVGEHELDWMRMATAFMKTRDDWVVRREDIKGDRFKLVFALKRKENEL